MQNIIETAFCLNSNSISGEELVFIFKEGLGFETDLVRIHRYSRKFIKLDNSKLEIIKNLKHNVVVDIKSLTEENIFSINQSDDNFYRGLFK